jgi:xylulokinase
MTSKGYLLGIDIGGTGIKAGLFDLYGRQVSGGYQESTMISISPGQAEQDAEAWWQSAVLAVRETLQGSLGQSVRAVGVGCTNGLIAVDQDGKPLRNAIMLWDQRTVQEVAAIRASVSTAAVFEVAGNPVAPGAFSLPTILWLMHNEPEVFARTHKLMVPGGYLVQRLTGEFTIDESRACTTLLFDIKQRRWHQPFFDALGIPIEKMPTSLPSLQTAGSITRAAARETGLPAGTPVIAGCMDTVGASVGLGVVKPGSCFVIMGTAARAASVIDNPTFDERFMNCNYIFPGQYMTIAAMNGIGSTMRWLRDHFGHLEQQLGALTGQDVYELLIAQAEGSPPGSKGLIYLPYISGERSPVWDPYSRAVFFGITLGHSRADIFRAALEGTAYAIRHNVELMEEQLGTSFEKISISGAPARSAAWVQIIADVLGKKIIRVNDANAEVLGAALLAGLGTQAYTGLDEMYGSVPLIHTPHEPSDSAHTAYNDIFPLYKALYPAFKPYFEWQASLCLTQGWVS